MPPSLLVLPAIVAPESNLDAAHETVPGRVIYITVLSYYEALMTLSLLMLTAVVEPESNLDAAHTTVSCRVIYEALMTLSLLVLPAMVEPDTNLDAALKTVPGCSISVGHHSPPLESFSLRLRLKVPGARVVTRVSELGVGGGALFVVFSNERNARGEMTQRTIPAVGLP